MASPTRVTAALVEELLYGSEGVDLDFKREQYLFQGASDLDRAELLKDVLAFANAFRRNDAYILVGVEETAGGRANVIGVADHLKDADLQQFVNSKTNRNIVFGYHSVEVEGKSVGVIRIQDQQRPIFLKKDFGFDEIRKRHRLAANTVYFRVGSSTKEASPEDTARMGSHTASQPTYEVDLQFAHYRERAPSGRLLESTHNFVFCDGKIPDYTTQGDSISAYGIEIPRLSMAHDNPRFWRQAYNYLMHWGSLTEVGFFVQNRSDATIDDVTVELVFAKDGGFVLVAGNRMPTEPEPEYDLIQSARNVSFPTHTTDIRVEKRGDQEVATLWFGKLQAGQKKFLEEALYLGNTAEKHLVVDAVIRADQFPSPLTVPLEFRAKGTAKKLEWRELKEIIEDKFFRDEDGTEDGSY